MDQGVLRSCTHKDVKELFAEVLLLILGLWIRISSSLFLGLEPLLCTSKLHPLAAEWDLVIGPACLGLLLGSLLVLVCLLSLGFKTLPLCLLRRLDALLKLDDSRGNAILRILVIYFLSTIPL